MGCDIQGYVEINTIGGDYWWRPVITIDAFSLRYYEYFSDLFGVRGPGGVAKKRGLPKFFLEFDEDMGIILQKIKGSDYHSHTWATFEEIKSKWSRTAKESFGHAKDWEFLFELCESLQEHFGKDNVRLVVWFNG